MEARKYWGGEKVRRIRQQACPLVERKNVIILSQIRFKLFVFII